ncbi:hypothetical protein E2C01_036221 [Portunus trituberculatus]|uniref:Uncharacterized protein n=1 Tax=Portunus trituberculatus TaxID=210409 RepID=A0A5B7FBW3_PORTR|nr:hypothetical protein [Portunus trituberculatus]
MNDVEEGRRGMMRRDCKGCGSDERVRRGKEGNDGWWRRDRRAVSFRFKVVGGEHSADFLPTASDGCSAPDNSAARLDIPDPLCG